MRIIGFILTLFIALILINALWGKVIREMKNNYQKADTSVIIQNGKSDTVITKKTLPWYLK